MAAATNRPTDIVKPAGDGTLKNLPVANAKNVGMAEGDGSTNNSNIQDKSGINIPNTKELRLATGPLRDGSKAAQFITVSDKNVNIDDLNPLIKKNLTGMIEEYGEYTGKKVIMTDGFRSRAQQEALYRKDPQKAAPPGRSLHEFGLAFDMDSKNLNEMDSLGLMRKYGFIRPIGQETWHAEPIGIQTDIARAKEDEDFRSMAINSSLYKGGAGYGTMPNANKYRRSTDVSMDVLNAKAKEVDPAEILGKKANPNTGSQAEAKAAAPTTPKATQPTAQAPASKAPAPTPSTTQPTPAQNTKPMTGGNIIKTGYNPISEQVTPGAVIKKDKDTGNWIRMDNKPAGQTYTDTPMPAELNNIRADKGVVNAIYKAGQTSGVDPYKLMTFAAVESDFNPNAKAGSSSATGLFQFTKDTWNDVSKKAGVTGASPTDPYASSLAASKYIQENESSISKVVSNPGVFENYLAHFLGASGASTFLKAPDTSIAATVLPNAAKSNRNIFYSGDRALTVAEVKANIRNKLSTKAKTYGIPVKIDGPTSVPAPQGAQAAKQSTPTPQAAQSTPQPAAPSTNIVTQGESSKAPAPVATPAIYNKPTSIMADPMQTSTKPSVQASSGPQENYSKLVSDSIATSLEYQKTMVKHLSSIDSKIAEVLKGASSDKASKAEASPSGNRYGDRQYKEPLDTTVDLRRKQQAI